MKKITVLMMAAAMLLLTGCGRSDEQIIADVQPLMEKIVQQNLDSRGKCTQILDIQKVDSDHYTATAEVEYRRSRASTQQMQKAIFGGYYRDEDYWYTVKEYLKISIAYDKDQVLVRVIQ